MNERQAWIALGRRIKAGIDLCCGGLCCEVGALKAPEHVVRRLTATLSALPKPHDYGGAVYAWTRTPNGKRARIAFCARQAARCASEAKQRKRKAA